MPSLIGTTPEYGIPAQEEGLLLESLSFEWKGEWYEQKDNRGRKCGALLVDEEMSFSASGAVALGATNRIKGGALLSLVNVVPDLWQQKPAATTALVTSPKVSMSNTAAQKMDYSGTIYAFGSAAGE